MCERWYWTRKDPFIFLNCIINNCVVVLLNVFHLPAVWSTATAAAVKRKTWNISFLIEHLACCVRATEDFLSITACNCVFVNLCLKFSCYFADSKLMITYFNPKFVSSLMVANFSMVTDSIVSFTFFHNRFLRLRQHSFLLRNNRFLLFRYHRHLTKKNTRFLCSINYQCILLCYS